jgi:formate dehydrogenase maturation protein FdhE
MQQPPPLPTTPITMSDHAKATCTAHLCPKCGVPDHVSVEQELLGKESIIRCHCRLCGHSWHPVVTRR